MAKEANVKNQNKEKKHKMKDFKAELKRVVWPTPKQLLNNTVAVIVIVLITAVIVFALDLTFKTLNTYGVDKIKSMVASNETNEVETTGNTTTENLAAENELVEIETNTTEQNTVNE